MKRSIFAILALLISGALAHAATPVQCVGSAAMDTATLQASATAGGDYFVTGMLCALNAPITLSTARTTFTFEAEVNSTASPVFDILNTREIAILGTPRQPYFRAGYGIPTAGAVVRVTNSHAIALRDWESYSTGEAVNLVSGSGLRASNLHLNGVPGAHAPAFRFSSWDTAQLSALLIEEFDNGIRLGGSAGDVFCVQMTDLIIDRLNATNGTALWIEPGTGHQVTYVQSSNLWASQMQWNVVINVSGAGTSARDVQLENSMFASSHTSGFTINGPVANFQSGKAIFN